MLLGSRSKKWQYAIASTLCEEYFNYIEGQGMSGANKEMFNGRFCVERSGILQRTISVLEEDIPEKLLRELWWKTAIQYRQK